MLKLKITKRQHYRSLGRSFVPWGVSGQTEGMRMHNHELFTPGQHLFVDCGGYSHHGIYAGQGKVIHFDSTLARKFLGTLSGRPPSIDEVDLAEFSGGKTVHVRHYETPTFSSEDCLKYARSRLGEQGYDLFENNCEHFAVWCKTGHRDSTQVEAARKAASTAAAGVAMGSAIARSGKLLPGPYRLIAYSAGAALAIGTTTYRYVVEKTRNRKKNLS